MILAETNIHDSVYCWNRLGYNVSCLMATTTESVGAKGRVTIVSIERLEGWLIKLLCFHRTNVVIC